MHATRRIPRLVLLPAGALLLLLVLPVAALLWRAALEGALLTAATNRAVLDALLLSVVTTSITLLVAVGLGTPLAWLLARRPVRGRRILETLIELPIVLPPSVAGLALLLLLGRQGLLGGVLRVAGIEIAFSTAAVVIAQLFVAAPLYVRTARSAFGRIDVDLEDAARADGAGEWAVFRLITAPIAAGALGAGAVLAWARALGEFGATIMFAGNIVGRTQTLPLVVYSEFQSSLDASIAAAAILVIAAFAVLVAVRIGRGVGWGG
jgi:molybdate transport system permease protein